MRREALVLLAAVAVLPVAGAAVTQEPTVQPGTTTAREMSGAEAHEYRVSLQAGQALRVRVTQIGVDVVLGVLEPDGKLIVEVDSPTGGLGEETVSVIAAAPGDYVIRVRPYGVAAGRYEMHVEPLRTATAEDRQRATVYRTLGTARRLIDSGDPRQVADGVAQLQQATASARASGDMDLAGVAFTQLLITNARAAFDGLSLPSIEGSVTVYFSPGHEERARTLQSQLTRAVNYFSDRLGVTRTVVLAVLARDDWPPLTNTPYGMPWSYAAESLVVMPATHAMFDEFTVGIRGQDSASADIARAVQSTGMSLEEGVRLVADASMYHELGHVLASAYGIGQQNLWFGEFVANYVSHAYQADAAPDPRIPLFADLLRNWLASASQPTYTSLDDLEQHYLSMDLVNYAWYQAQFERRAIEIYEREGLAFLSRLKSVLPVSEHQPVSVADVLTRLERISRGFVSWGESLGRRPPGAVQTSDRPDPIVEWLRSRAQPITHVEPRADQSDLQFLSPVLGGARVVGLGEATHGTREVFQFKQRLVQFLVTELGFTTLAMEASASEIEPLNDYVLHGTGDVNDSLTAQGYIAWDTEEIVAMMEWIRGHNSRVPDGRKVQVVGLDILLHSRGHARVLDYLRAHITSHVTDTEEVFAILAEEEAKIASPNFRPDRLASSLRSLEELRDVLLARQKAERAESAGHLELALQDVNRMIQRAQSAKARDVAGRLDRSEAMGHNALELIGNPTVSKVIVWAHNVHVAAQYADGRANLGSVLRGALGDAYYALGFEFESGRVQVRTSTAQGAGGPLGEIEVAPAPVQSLPWYLAQSNAADLFVDLRGPRPPVVEGWLAQAVEAHFIWWAHKPDQARTVREPAGRYDGLVFIRTSSPARPTKHAIERAASGKGL